MTSLIGVGLGARRRAQQGFGAVAQLEARENRQMDMLDAAREQQEMSNLGTGAGFGAMYGLSKLPTAAATGAGATGAGAAGAGATGAGAAGAGGAAAAGSGGAAAGAGAAGATGAAAGGAGSALATLAMPIAIGLGAAFLINKLFD